MRKIITLLFIALGVLIFTSQVFADTDVGGNILVEDTTWVKSKSPYVISKTVQIAEGATLTIEPGVEINIISKSFDQSVMPLPTRPFVNRGTIIAKGTADNHIIFINGEGELNRIDKIFDGGIIDLSFCEFNNLYYAWSSKIVGLNNSLFNDVWEIIIEPSSDIVTIEYNKFINLGLLGLRDEDNKADIAINNNLFYHTTNFSRHVSLDPVIIGPVGSGGIKSTVVQFNSFINLKGYVVRDSCINLSNNYWGTTDANEIDKMIWDKYDQLFVDQNKYCAIEYQPILSSPHPDTPALLTAMTSQEEETASTIDINLSKRLSGNILLQIESKGEAWYVYPDNNQRYYLGRPADAFAVMRRLGLGAKHDFIARQTIFPDKVLGKILLDVEKNGEAYYIYPKDKKKYYLGRPEDAFRIMRELGLGITNDNISKIEVGE